MATAASKAVKRDAPDVFICRTPVDKPALRCTTVYAESAGLSALRVPWPHGDPQTAYAASNR
jgi:hypothetical protein